MHRGFSNGDSRKNPTAELAEGLKPLFKGCDRKKLLPTTMTERLMRPKCSFNDGITSIWMLETISRLHHGVDLAGKSILSFPPVPWIPSFSSFSSFAPFPQFLSFSSFPPVSRIPSFPSFASVPPVSWIQLMSGRENTEFQDSMGLSDCTADARDDDAAIDEPGSFRH
jgi:hypothetical protein